MSVSEKLPALIILPTYPWISEADHRWRCDLECFLATHKKLVVVTLNPGVNIDDVTKLLQKLEYVDQTRLAVFGQHFGGLLALHALMSNKPEFPNLKCGLVVAPIINSTFISSFTKDMLLAMNKSLTIPHEVGGLADKQV